MAILTRDQILKADDLKQETVKVPEWGGEVIVSTMTGAERDAFEWEVYGSNPREHNIENIRAKMIAATLIDENGKHLFSTAKDVLAIGQKSARALDRIFSVARRLNGFGMKDIEELEKNLPKIPGANSTSL